VEPKTGQYSVLYRGESWYGTGAVSVFAGQRWYRSAALAGSGDKDGKLVVHDLKTGAGKDLFGAFEFLDLYWKLPETGAGLITGFKVYRDRPYIVFVQKFPGGVPRYANGAWAVPSVIFPQFAPKSPGARKDLHAWTSGGMGAHFLARGDAAGLQGTVDILLLADRDYHTLVLSPFRNYLVATQQSSQSMIHCGIEGLVETLPAGFEHEHILVAGKGILDTFRGWGQALLERSGKEPLSKYQDDVLKYLVYMDDYGAYYREHGFKEEGYGSYEDVILGVEAEAKRNGLRIGAYHIYDQDQLRYQEGLFEPRADLFPRGPQWLRERLGKPLRCYYLWLAANSPYRKQFAFLETQPASEPRWMGDVFYSPEYWRYTADKMASWGCVCLQHDYLSAYERDGKRSGGVKAMMSRIDTMDTYFRNMAAALREKGMTSHYCMQLPRNVLQSTENPVMVSLQGSRDHHVATRRNVLATDDTDPYVWRHLIFTSAFYGAAGIWPSRDQTQTMADANAYEDILLANLLGGSIELGHRIGECDFDLVRKTFREGDGLILKPDRPIAPLDRCYIDGGAVGYTESSISGKKWYYVLSFPAASYLPDFKPADLGVSGRWAVYHHDAGFATVQDAAVPVNLRREVKHEYFVVAPLLGNGMAVFGDTAKFVTMADKRLALVETSGEALRVGVISNDVRNPIVTGYSPRRPGRVSSGAQEIPEVTSLARLKAARSGWFWDYQSKLWHVKIDFKGAAEMEARQFQIQ
jgi:hypothetical protein